MKWVLGLSVGLGLYHPSNYFEKEIEREREGWEVVRKITTETAWSTNEEKIVHLKLNTTAWERIFTIIVSLTLAKAHLIKSSARCRIGKVTIPIVSRTLEFDFFCCRLSWFLTYALCERKEKKKRENQNLFIEEK